VRTRWETLCAQPALVGNAVEEVLRYDSSVIHWRRRAVDDVELSGTTIPAGADVIVAIGAANRDPAVFDDPEVFDVRRRNAREHLSFGFGPHICLGAPLARLEAAVVFEELISRQPNLRFVEDQKFEFMPIIGFRGPTSLWVET
jgi:cytochrome P450